jgi:hypothetical protein
VTALRFGAEFGCCPSRGNAIVASVMKGLSQLVTSEPAEYFLLAGGVRYSICWLAGGCWRELGR